MAEWLKAHPEIQVITRDRSSAYAEAATRGAPQAVQCADRWHLFKNLAEAVEKTVVAHHACLREPTTADDAPAAGVETPSTADEAAADHEAMAEPPAPGLEAESGLAARIRERFADVQALRAQGKGIRAIARELRLDRKTARRFSLARSAEELVVKATSRASLLDEHKPYLNQRWRRATTKRAHSGARRTPGLGWFHPTR
ncbi:transposase [Saccharopolyspora shandongensis]